MTDVRERILRKQLLKIAEERGYGSPEFRVAAVPITGSNFTSELFHATISAPGREDLNVFAKVAVMGEEHRKLIPNKMFEVEQYVYTKLLKTFKELEERHEVPEQHRLVAPEFYGYSESYLEEVIVLEDLSVGGFETYDRFRSIEWEYAASAVEELAKLHGLSLAFEKEYPNEYEEAKEVFKTNPYDIGEGTGTTEVMWKMIDQSIDMIREENQPRVRRLFNSSYNPSYLYGPIGKRMVIVHGDYKQANLMHKIDKNGKLQVIIIDYQTLRPSCAASDLLYFMFNCCDGKMRQQHYHQLIEHYYDSVTAVLRRLHLDPGEVFPRADFDEDLKEMLPHSLRFSVMMLPIFYVEQSDVRQVDSEGTIEAMADMIMNPSALCAQRLNELVDDCVRWGVV
ncbi:hypothetical protein ABMA28_006574 [Loxostege sticticalis]|uniref:CHK kinase-like domain-containing protein n=1 Tax=Loxostege sticticalis TaxID=481309 RepID=A0ABD0SNZ9_LOXSC